MRYLLASLVASCLMGGIVANAAVESEVKFNNPITFIVKESDPGVFFTLLSNPSTGYSWKLPH